jgi:hypothetical protein
MTREDDERAGGHVPGSDVEGVVRKKPEYQKPGDIDVASLSQAELEALKAYWQVRWRAPGAQSLINRIDRELLRHEKAAAVEPMPEPPAEKGDEEAVASSEGAKQPEDRGTRTFTMPPGPEERTGDFEGIPAETEPDFGGQGAREPQTLDERLNKAEGMYFRSIFGLHDAASDDELRAMMRERQLERLGLPPHADDEYIAQAEHQWRTESQKLPPITNPDDEAQLAPYYRLYRLEPGAGFAAIFKAQEMARFEHEGLPAIFVSDAPKEEAQAPQERPAPTERRPEATADARPEREETERAGTDTEAALRIIDATLNGLSRIERFSYRKERQNLEKLRKSIHGRDDVLSDECLKGLGTTISMNMWLSRKNADARIPLLADAYDLFTQKGWAHPKNPEFDGQILSTISRHSAEGRDRARAMYHNILRVWGDAEIIHEGEREIRTSVADRIGEAWFRDLRDHVYKAERAQNRKAVADVEALAERLRVLETPPLPETLVERVNAALDAIAILHGEAIPSPPEAGEGRRVELRPGLSEARVRYARALTSQSRMIGRTSEEELEANRIAYQTAIEEAVATKVHEVAKATPQTAEGEAVSREAETRVRASLIECLLSNRAEEESALRDAMRSSAERTALDRFKQFWRSHPKARIAISLALTGATAASAATGNVFAAGMFQGAKSLLSGTSTAIATEAIWEKSRETFGETKKLTREKIAQLSDHDLERRIAAHTVQSTRYPHGHYEWALHRAQTLRLLTAEYHERKRHELEQHVDRMRQAALTTDQMVETLSLHSMEDELSLHRAYEAREGSDRRDAIRKWSISLGTGFLVGTLTGTVGLLRAAKIAEATHAQDVGDAAVDIPEHAAPVAETPAPPETTEQTHVPGTSDALPHEMESDSTPAEAPASSESPSPETAAGETATQHEVASEPSAPETPESAHETTETATAVEHHPPVDAETDGASAVHEPTPELDLSHGALELTQEGRLAYEHVWNTYDLLSESDEQTVGALKRALHELPAKDALKRKIIEQFIDEQPGSTPKFAKEYAKAIAKLFKTIPQDEIRKDDTIGRIFQRIFFGLEREASPTG